MNNDKQTPPKATPRMTVMPLAPVPPVVHDNNGIKFCYAGDVAEFGKQMYDFTAACVAVALDQKPD